MSTETLDRDVRVFVFEESAKTARVPQAPQIANAMGLPESEVRESLKRLGLARVLILAPNDASVWAANPFCAVPSGFRVDAGGLSYWGICIWDALGIPAALGKSAVLTAPCGDCGDSMTLEVNDASLVRSKGIVHIGVPAKQWWDNIGFT